MRKLLSFLLLIAISALGIAQNKTGYITPGFTMLSKPFVFTAADSALGNGGFHIKTSATYTIYIVNTQKYLQTQVITTTLATCSGSPSVLITLYGKVNTGDAWTSIGTPVTWTSTGNNPVTISNTTAANYNFLEVTYVCSGATQCVKIVTFDAKTANAFPYGATLITGTAGATISGAAISLNASSNYVVNIGTGTTTSAVTLGGTGTQSIALGNGAGIKTVALGSSTTTSTTTLLSGSNGLNLNVSNNQPTNINTGSSTGLVTIGGGSGTVAVSTTNWGVTAAGVATFTGLVTPTASPVLWAKGGPVALATSGTDQSSYKWASLVG